MTTTYGTIGPLVVAWGSRGTSFRRAGASPAASGQVARRQFQSSASRQSSRSEVRSWELDIVDMGATERADLLADFDAGCGQALPMLWTPPAPHDAGGDIPVRFVDPELTFVEGPPGRWRARVKLEEVL